MTKTVISEELAALLAEAREVLTRWPLGSEEEASWRSRARCRGVDPELFYPARGDSLESSRNVCRHCPVRAECLATALANGEKFGTWGGVSENERRSLRRRLATPAQTAHQARATRVSA